MSYNKLFIIGLIFLLSCTKEPDPSRCFDGVPVEGLYEGNCTVTTNFLEWDDKPCYITRSLNSRFSLTTTNSYNRCDAFYLDIDNLNLSLTESLFDMKNDSPTAKMFIIHGGDAIAENFELIDTTTNIIEIKEIGLDSSVIKGVFNLTFVLVKNSIGKGLYKPDLPDTLIFRNGTFAARFVK